LQQNVTDERLVLSFRHLGGIFRKLAESSISFAHRADSPYKSDAAQEPTNKNHQPLDCVMSDMINNVKTINSAMRTLMLLGVTGAVGYGGWFGYQTYVKPGFEAKQAIADLADLREEFDAQSKEMAAVQELNDRLETSMKLLKVDRRIANIKVLEKGVDDEGQPYLEVRFSEVNEYGEIIGSPRDFTLRGEKFYIDGWVATFEDKYIEDADELRAASLFVFKSIYGDAERPMDGQRLDTQTVEFGPPGIYKSDRQTAFEQQIWNDFWQVCNNRKLQKELGIRASQGQASYLEAEEGRTYQVNIRSSGGMSLTPLDDQ
jgi:hypothetical protein